MIMEDISEIYVSGAQVIIEYLDEDGGYKRYSTRIEELDSRGLILQAPIKKRAPIRINDGQEVEIIKEEDRDAYITRVDVVSNEREEVPLIITTYPEKIEKLPRRSYFRLNVDCPLAVGGEVDIEGRVINLSGNGLMALFDEADLDYFKKGEKYILCIELPSSDMPLEFKAEAVRVMNPKKDKNRPTVAFHFPNIPESLRDEIISYLFQRQRRLIKMGIIDQKSG